MKKNSIINFQNKVICRFIVEVSQGLQVNGFFRTAVCGFHAADYTRIELFSVQRRGTLYSRPNEPHSQLTERGDRDRERERQTDRQRDTHTYRWVSKVVTYVVWDVQDLSFRIKYHQKPWHRLYTDRHTRYHTVTHQSAVNVSYITLVMLALRVYMPSYRKMRWISYSLVWSCQKVWEKVRRMWQYFFCKISVSIR